MDFSRDFGAYGSGNYVRAFPLRELMDFADFSGGFFSALNREKIPDNCTPFALDMEVTKANRLKRAPGTTLIETFAGREPAIMYLHGSLDFTAELIFFDAPYMGVKRTGATVWEDKGLHSRVYAHTNFGGTFIFTDGRKVYARQANDGLNIEEIPDAPVAQTYASWAGRVWAGMAVIDGNMEPLGLMWTAANGDYRDWTGIGSNFELLIDEIAAGDRLISLTPMGLDFMAVFLRNSVWIGRRTGLAATPGEFTPRVPGTGAVNEPCVRATQAGVIYLSDNGVEIFDGNTSRHLSTQIDNELLPLDYANIELYSATYNPVTKRYYLHTPAGVTWVFELEYNRWFRRTLDAVSSIVWPIQVPFTLWSELIGTWEDQEQYSWYDYAGASEGKADVIFLGDELGESVGSRSIVKEDPESESYFGEHVVPRWELRPKAAAAINILLTTKEYLFEYEGAGAFELWAFNNEGVYELLLADVLAAKSPRDSTSIKALKTGRLSGLQFRIASGDIELARLQIAYQQRGPRIELGSDGQAATYPDREENQDFTQLAVEPPTNGWTGRGGPVLVPTFTVERVSYRLYRFTADVESSGTVESWEWDFGDGNEEAGDGEPIEHLFDEPGTYDITLTVEDEWGRGANYRYRLTIEEEAAEELTLVADPDQMVSVDRTYVRETPAEGFSERYSGIIADEELNPTIGGSPHNLWLGVGAQGFGPYDAGMTHYVGVSIVVDTSSLSAEPSAGTRVRVWFKRPDTVFVFPIQGPDVWLQRVRLYHMVTPPPVIGSMEDVEILYLAWSALATPVSDDEFALASATAEGAWFEFELNATGRGLIDLDGESCFILRFEDDVTSSMPAGFGFTDDGSSDSVVEIINEGEMIPQLVVVL